MKYRIMLTAISTALLLATATGHAQRDLDTTGIRLWLERADAIRMPETYDADNYFTSYQLGPNSFRGFTANGCLDSGDGPNCTQAIDGTAVWDVATAYPPHPDPHRDALHSTSVTAWATCGQWLNSTLMYGGTLYGFGHGENPKPNTTDTCGTNFSTHHKTMTLWNSPTGSTAGLQGSWTHPVLIIDSTDGETGSNESGEGDCTAIADTTYAYLFCRHPVGTTTGVARAPLSSLGGSSGTFVKYDNGWGSQPGINGADSAISGWVAGSGATSSQLGSGASYWKDNNWVMLLNVADAGFQGIKASFTGLPNLQSNLIEFTTLPAPLFVQEVDPIQKNYPYKSDPPRNLYIYPSVLSLVDGTRTWDLTQKGQFLLAYAFVPPHNTLEQRILAMRSVSVTKSSTLQDPQVLVALTTRYDSGFDQRYSSTQPVAFGSTSSSYPPASFSQILVDTVGYLVQLPAANLKSQGQTLTKLVECRSNAPWPLGHPDRLITTNTCDNQYDEDTVAGYSYPNKPATGNSVEIYRCSSTANGTHWVSTSSTCEGLGTKEKPLGWILTK